MKFRKNESQRRQVDHANPVVVVAALARLNPLAVVFVAIILGGITNAGYSLQGPDFPAGLVGTLEGLILFCTLGGEVLVRYRLVRTRRVDPAVTV